MEIGQLLARGRTAEVYHWKQRQVIKLFKQEISYAAIEREYRASQFVSQMNLPVPQVGEMLQIHDRWGIEYQKISGVTLLQHMLQEPNQALAAARLLAKLHLTVHQIFVPPGYLPSQKRGLERVIQRVTSLDEPTKTEILRRLSHLTEGSVLCHCDFHPENILLTDSGPVIIDWMNAVVGNPAGDVARTWVILSYAGPGEIPVRQKATAFRERLAEEYLQHYLQAGTLSRQAVQQWILPVAAARLAERIPQEEQNLHSLVNLLVQR